MKKIILWILIPFIAIQFIDMNIPQIIESKANHNIDAPKKVTDILERSCYDCHSNSLIYPWYSKIAPLSWYTQSHVKNGRRVVNFSIWKSYDKEKQLKVLKELPKALLIRMPLPDYLWLHQEAKLSKEDKEILSTWAKELKEKI